MAILTSSGSSQSDVSTAFLGRPTFFSDVLLLSMTSALPWARLLRLRFALGASTTASGVLRSAESDSLVAAS